MLEEDKGIPTPGKLSSCPIAFIKRHLIFRESPKALDSFLIRSPNLERSANEWSSSNDPIDYADSQRLSDIPDTKDPLIQRSDA